MGLTPREGYRIVAQFRFPVSTKQLGASVANDAVFTFVKGIYLKISVIVNIRTYLMSFILHQIVSMQSIFFVLSCIYWKHLYFIWGEGGEISISGFDHLVQYDLGRCH